MDRALDEGFGIDVVLYYQKTYDKVAEKTYWYNKLSRQIRELARKIKELDVKDPFRTEATSQFIEKLYSMGLIPTKRSLALADEVSASSFCRRRLTVVMVRNHMAQTLKAATTFIEQGHVRVGPEVVTDPAFMVTKQLEDFVTWVDTSAIRKHVLDYNEMEKDQQEDPNYASWTYASDASKCLVFTATTDAVQWVQIYGLMRLKDANE